MLLGALVLSLASHIAVMAQVAPAPGATMDTTRLRSKTVKPKPDTQQEDGLSDIITLAAYHAITSGGPIIICESVPTYQKRNKKDSLPLFVQEHLHWPVIGQQIDVEGRVFVSFVVGTDGNVYRTKIVKGLYPDFDTEALRAVQFLSGHFSPAVCGGVARPHEMVVPVSFFLN